MQDIINRQAQNLCDSVGVIQQYAQPSFFSEFDWKARSTRTDNPIIQSVLKDPPPPDYSKHFSKVIRETSSQINYLIDGLPDEDLSLEIHNSALSLLHNDYIESGKELLKTVDQLEKKLEFVRNKLVEISEVQLTTEALEAEILKSYYG